MPKTRPERNIETKGGRLRARTDSPPPARGLEAGRARALEKRFAHERKRRQRGPMVDRELAEEAGRAPAPREPGEKLGLRSAERDLRVKAVAPERGSFERAVSADEVLGFFREPFAASEPLHLGSVINAIPKIRVRGEEIGSSQSRKRRVFVMEFLNQI
jgi:hypothetical protein